MKIAFGGHACMLLEGSNRILFDPFLTGNPFAALDAATVQPDLILVSHAHSDHIGDAVSISQRCGATIVCVNELGVLLEGQASVHRMHIGGKKQFGQTAVQVTLALHGSGLETEAPGLVYAGPACGFLVWLDGLCCYFAGDTGLFGDMQSVIGRHKIDVAFLPIGDNYTMGPDDALTAIKWLQPRHVVPMHYNTFPLIAQDAVAFARKAEQECGCCCHVLQPGEFFELK